MAAKIELALFAPRNQGAALIGSFNHWKAITMQKHSDGWFRTTVELEDGFYAYKFRVQSKSPFYKPNQWITISDPLATAITDDESKNAILYVKNGQRKVDDYVWQHDEIPLLPNSELLIYKLFIGGFHIPVPPCGTFASVTAKLDYLQELGVSALELIPVSKCPDDGRGYNPCYLLAVNNRYGSSADLKHLVDACHGRGIRVILDLVLNHTVEDMPLYQLDRDYWFQTRPTDPVWNWGPEYDYNRYDPQLDLKPAWVFAEAVCRHWIQEYHIDGFRYDATRQLNNYDFLGFIVHKCHKYAGNKPFYNISEHVPESPDITRPGEGPPMDGTWHDSFCHGIRRLLGIYAEDVSLDFLKDVLDGKRQGYLTSESMINYIGNHDHTYLMKGLQERFPQATAFQCAQLAVLVWLSAMGVPLLWMGEEFGEDQGRLAEVDIELDWDLLEQEPHRQLLDYYRRMLAIRRQNPALQGDNIAFIHEDETNKLLAYHRWNDEGNQVVIFFHWSDAFLEEYVIHSFPRDGHWVDLLDQQDYTVQDGALGLSIGPWEGKMLVFQPGDTA